MIPVVQLLVKLVTILHQDGNWLVLSHGVLVVPRRTCLVCIQNLLCWPTGSMITSEKTPDATQPVTLLHYWNQVHVVSLLHHCMMRAVPTDITWTVTGLSSSIQTRVSSPSPSPNSISNTPKIVARMHLLCMVEVNSSSTRVRGAVTLGHRQWCQIIHNPRWNSFSPPMLIIAERKSNLFYLWLNLMVFFCSGFGIYPFQRLI